MWPAVTNEAVYLDSNIFIYAVQKSDRWAKPAEALLKAIDEQKVRAVASELVLAEVLSKPFALKIPGTSNSISGCCRPGAVSSWSM
jgi:predicted nucleic acid-binding protein